MQRNFDQLDIAFLEAMNEIGQHGQTKYGPLPRTREGHANPARTTSIKIAEHACTHFGHYLSGKPHDHFGTRKHQLAAVAFNAMMEFRYLLAEGGDKTRETPEEFAESFENSKGEGSIEFHPAPSLQQLRPATPEDLRIQRENYGKNYKRGPRQARPFPPETVKCPIGCECRACREPRP